MPLTFVAGAHNEAGGLALSVSVVAPAAIQAGDLLLMTALALENTRGWGAYINGTGEPSACSDLFTDGSVPGPGGRTQYTLDSGSGPRLFWWAGWRIATSADVGSPTYTFNATASPASGVGMAASLVAYRHLGSAFPIYSFASALRTNTIGTTTDQAPATATPPGSSAAQTFTASTTSATFASAATFAVVGDVGDFNIVCLPIGLGGTGLWNAPGALTSRLQAGGAGGPWYMETWADGPTPGSVGAIGRLPLLGAG